MRLKILLPVFVGWTILVSSCNSRENKLIAEGNSIIEKIEAFKKNHNQLPNSLNDLGIKVIDEANPPIYYQKEDSIHYTVSFGTVLGESKIYYSDSKKWENFNREMK